MLDSFGEKLEKKISKKEPMEQTDTMRSTLDTEIEYLKGLKNDNTQILDNAIRTTKKARWKLYGLPRFKRLAIASLCVTSIGFGAYGVIDMNQYNGTYRALNERISTLTYEYHEAMNQNESLQQKVRKGQELIKKLDSDYSWLEHEMKMSIARELFLKQDNDKYRKMLAKY